jgi:hypothetical protein
MALTSCAQCRQPFYASCHDGACIGTICPYCAYADIAPPTHDDDPSPGHSGAMSDGTMLSQDSNLSAKVSTPPRGQ